ncbi:MAG TPA: hypothetical protein VGN55_10595 [Xanthobacteraceae bacterium]|jgi:hypothetical protein
MSNPNLVALEHEVEAARQRVTADVERLRSPATLSEFKDEVWSEARQSKDEVVEKATDYFHETVQSVIAEIKGRAAANPAAALAIGAGLAWHLLRHPPITSLLVGAGVVSLLKTKPDRDVDFAAGASAQAHEIASAVQQWGAEAGEAARNAASQVVDSVVSLADGAAAAAGEAGVSVRESAAQFASTAALGGRRASAAISEALPEARARDQMLLGAAALAIVAAVGIAARRPAGQ